MAGPEYEMFFQDVFALRAGRIVVINGFIVGVRSLIFFFREPRACFHNFKVVPTGIQF